MKISEAIQKLAKLQKEWGDLEIINYHDDTLVSFEYNEDDVALDPDTQATSGSPVIVAEFT